MCEGGSMNLEERKKVEDKIDKMLVDLTKGEQVVLYKTLYALGIRISDCDEILRKEQMPVHIQEKKNSRSSVTPQVYLPRGWPPIKAS
jgi:hypothetical protein